MPVRKTKLVISDSWREKIQWGVILQRLSAHALGENAMSPTQVKAADILLKKIIPDLSKIDMNDKRKAPTPVTILQLGNDPAVWQRISDLQRKPLPVMAIDHVNHAPSHSGTEINQVSKDE